MTSCTLHPRSYGLGVLLTSTISVCIATYRRPERLALLLNDLAHQTLLPQQVVVVDNDAAASARAIVDVARSRRTGFELVYEVQPLRNISKTRNRTVALATGEWLAFVDDDERTPAPWLALMLAAARRFQADGVLGPVDHAVPKDAPGWIRKGNLYPVSHWPTGSIAARESLAIGNAFLHADMLHRLDGPFDESYGLSGGEDTDILLRFKRAGGQLIWCEEAVVIEPVEPMRQTLKWLLRRSTSGGHEFARKRLAGSYGHIGAFGKAQLFAGILARIALSSALSVAALPAGRHHAAKWLMRLFANLGKLGAFFGGRFEFYRDT